MKDVNPAAADIALKLNATERAIDGAMIQTSELLQSLLSGRRKMNLAASVGQRELDLAVASLSGLAAVRGQMVQAHEGLAAVSGQLEISWRMDGSWEQKVEDKPRGSLQLVA